MFRVFAFKKGSVKGKFADKMNCSSDGSFGPECIANKHTACSPGRTHMTTLGKFMFRCLLWLWWFRGVLCVKAATDTENRIEDKGLPLRINHSISSIQQRPVDTPVNVDFDFDVCYEELLTWFDSSANDTGEDDCCRGCPFPFVLSEDSLHQAVIESSPSSLAPGTDEACLKQERAELHSLLLEKYHQIFPLSRDDDEIIDWSQVIPYGWPTSVIFYNRYSWTRQDAQLLQAEMKEIKLLRDYRAFKEYSLAEKKTFHERLRMAALSASGAKENMPWKSYFKQQLPSLHLSSNDPRLWKGKDIQTIRLLLASMDQDEAEIHAITLENRKLEINAILLWKFEEALGDVAAKKQIDWRKVKQARGWPDDVLFYDSELWSLYDLELIEQAAKDITFEMTITGPRRNYSRIGKSKLLQQLLIELQVQSPDEICFSAIRRRFPGIHFTTANYGCWTKHDYAQLDRFLNDEDELPVCSSILGKRDFNNFHDNNQ